VALKSGGGLGEGDEWLELAHAPAPNMIANIRKETRSLSRAPLLAISISDLPRGMVTSVHLTGSPFDGGFPHFCCHASEYAFTATWSITLQMIA
jgi:hypothetical protein